ncbi:hypothetical protein ACFE04_020410 [Oxalis oulophora]
MEDNSGTPYLKIVHVYVPYQSILVKLNHPEATVYDLKIQMLRDNKFASVEYDYYYHNQMLTDNDIVTTLETNEGSPLLGVKRFLLTVRQGSKDYSVFMNGWQTVGDLKDKLRARHDNFPREFELQHPDYPGKILDASSTLISHGIENARSPKLIAY